MKQKNSSKRAIKFRSKKNKLNVENKQLNNTNKYFIKFSTNNLFKGRSPGLVALGGDSRSEGRGFESQCRILDGHFLTLICCKIVLMFV